MATRTPHVSEAGALFLRSQQGTQTFETVSGNPPERYKFTQGLFDAGFQKAGMLRNFAKEQSAFFSEGLQDQFCLG